MDRTYERILQEIMKPKQEHAHRLMQCLVAAVRPLRVKELAEVLAVDFKEGIPRLNPAWRWEDQEEAVMSTCSSLVTIVKDGDSRVVQFSHLSVKEFLTANRLADPIKDIPRYHIRLEAAHTILAQACLSVLLRLDNRLDRDKIENFPLARYAARHWVTHARVEGVSLRIKDAMECLFDADKPHFATWLGIYNEDQGDSYGHSPLAIAVPLYYAARLGFRDLAEHLIAEHPEQVNSLGGAYITPMHVAASKGHVEILSVLLEHGADLEGKGAYSHSPLHEATFEGKVEAMRYLLDHGANVDAQDDDGWTPLHMVLNPRKEQKTNIEAVRLLLERGADVKARTKYGTTPSRRSRARERKIAKLLAKYGGMSVYCSIYLSSRPGRSGR